MRPNVFGTGATVQRTRHRCLKREKKTHSNNTGEAIKADYADGAQ